MVNTHLHTLYVERNCVLKRLKHVELITLPCFTDFISVDLLSLNKSNNCLFLVLTLLDSANCLTQQVQGWVS